MMGNSGDKILPVHTCKIKLANDFSAFFYSKIFNIRSIDRYTYRRFGDKLFFWSSTNPLNLEFH